MTIREEVEKKEIKGHYSVLEITKQNIKKHQEHCCVRKLIESVSACHEKNVMF